MGLKKPKTSTLKSVSGMCWTQPAQRGVEYRPPYPIYSSFCMPEKPFLLRKESSKRGMAQDTECSTCWCYLSPGPRFCSAPSLLWLCRSSTSPAPHTHVSSSAASPGRQAVFKKQFPAEKDFFFPRSLSNELPGAGFPRETIVKAALPPTRKGCH